MHVCVGAQSLDADLSLLYWKEACLRASVSPANREPHVTISHLEQKDCGEAGVEVAPYEQRVDTIISPPHAIPIT